MFMKLQSCPKQMIWKIFIKCSNIMTLQDLEMFKELKPYIIAEVSGNHNGSIDRAKELIKLAKDNGADCVKIQTYTPDTMTIKSDNDDFKISENYGMAIIYGIYIIGLKHLMSGMKNYLNLRIR